jgi:hypothetical protein
VERSEGVTARKGIYGKDAGVEASVVVEMEDWEVCCLQAVTCISGTVHKSDCVLGVWRVGSRGAGRAVWYLDSRRVGRLMRKTMEERVVE